ncbi:hypothetical protein VB005_04144 [Metarhizium brunneum]
MSLSPEAIVAIVGVLVNIPPLILIVWKVWERYRSYAAHRLGV